MGNYDMCSLLIAAGSDIYLEDQCASLISIGTITDLGSRSGISASHYAWDTVLLAPTNTNRKLIGLFPQEEGGLDERQFSRIHKCVLGLIGSSLGTELAISTSSIDDVDDQGRTPLFWAVSRGDNESVELLLKYGANTDIESSNGTALHAAARSGNVVNLELLLSHGAGGVNTCDSKGLTLLCLAASFNDGNSCVQSLLSHGVDVNAKGRYGVTALLYAAQNDMLDNVKVLLENGANLDIIEDEGWTSMASCIFWNTDRMLRFLLDRGASLMVCTIEGDTLLHIAAKYGNLATLETLMDVDLSELESQDRNKDGRTPLDLAERREDVDKQWVATFKRLLTQCKEGWDNLNTSGQFQRALLVEMSDDDSLDEVFEDALEAQISSL
jgi:ankyrin repeat protein